MLQFSISVAYTFTNLILAAIILFKSRQNLLTQFYAFCVACLIALGVSTYMLQLNPPILAKLILKPTSVFLYAMFPFFFMHFMVVFVRRYEILKSKLVVLAIYFVGLFGYAMVLLGFIPTPFDAQGTVSSTGYVFYITWMSIFFSIGIAMLYSLVEGFSEKGVRSNLLLIGFALLLLILPGPFTESVFFTIFRQNVETYFLTSTFALIVVVYLVFRHKIIVNTPYESLKTALGVINDVIVKTNEDFRIDLIQGGVTLQLGYQEKEMIGKSVAEFVEPKEYFEAYRGFVRTGKMREAFFDSSVLHKNGFRVPMNFSFTPVFANEELVGYVGIGRNIADRRRAEILQDTVNRITQAADQSSRLDELYKAVHNAIRGAIPADNFYIALVDQRTGMLTFPYFEDEFDAPPPPRIPGRGRTEYVLRTSKSLLCNDETLAQLMKSGQVDVPRTGSRVWLGVPLRIAGTTIGVMAVQHYANGQAFTSQDQAFLEYVSSQVAKAIDRRRAEEQIRNQAALIDVVPNPIIVCDLDGRILFWSRGATGLYGWTGGETVDRRIWEVLFQGSEARYLEAREAVLQKGIWQAEISRRSKSEKDVIVESVWVLMKSEEELGESILIVETDITEKKSLEAQFLRAQRLESVGTLASGIAHDLNNVLAPILTAIQSLKRRYKTDQDQQLLSTLEVNTKRGAAIVRQVLMFARGVQGERMMLQPRHLVNEMVKVAGETFPKSIKISSDLPKTLWNIEGDSTQLHQVLLNLFVNARDAMPDGGTLSVTAQNMMVDEDFAKYHLGAAAGPHIVLAISDTGTGIPLKVIDKIFEPFFTTKDEGKGTGLGLSTVSGIVRSHNGFISVYSEEGKGSTFKVYLPAVETTDVAETQERYIVLRQGHGELVLVVDDEDPIRDVTKRVLETYNYRVVTAGNGEDGLMQYDRHNGEVKVVITDIMMPVMEGRTMIMELRNRSNNLPIIATSGLTTEERVHDLNELGVKAYIAKPFSEEKLVATVQQVIDEQTT